MRKQVVPKLQTIKFIENLLSASVDGIVVTDANQEIIMVNKSFCSFFGLSNDDMIETSLLEWFKRFDGNTVKTWFQLEKNVHANNTSCNVEFKILLQDREAYFRVNASLLDQIESEGPVIISIWRDVTELRQIQEDLIRKEKFAVIGRISGSIAHDIRHPLATIKNSSYFLNMALKDPDEMIKKHLKLIDKKVIEASEIITALMRLSESRAPEKSRVNTNEYVKEFFTEFPLPERIKLTVELESECSGIIADRLQLRQVFANITANAVRAMPEGGTLTVKTRVVQGGEFGVGSKKEKGFKLEGDFVEISFADTGSGMKKETMDKIFEPFFTTKGNGIGLGLSIVKDIIASNDGNITVESEEGKGSTFKIKFPAMRDL